MPRGCMHQYVLASPCGPAFFKPTAHRPASCCRENGVTLVAYSPLCQGLLTGKYSRDNRPTGPRAQLFTDQRYKDVEVRK